MRESQITISLVRGYRSRLGSPIRFWGIVTRAASNSVGLAKGGDISDPIIGRDAGERRPPRLARRAQVIQCKFPAGVAHRVKLHALPRGWVGVGGDSSIALHGSRA